MEADDLDVLRRALADLPAGPIPAQERVRIIKLLASAWDDLRGSDAERMTANKLVGRTEALSWQPPRLSFVIERHGSTVQGSTRAELHRWEVNVETGEATLEDTSRFRQVRPRAQSVRVEPLVTEVVRAIELHQKHPALEWRTATRVRVIPSQVQGLGEGFQQTVAGRRKRFIAALDLQLATLGWSRSSIRNRFEYERANASSVLPAR